LNIIFIATEIVPSKSGAFTGGLVNNIVRLSDSLTRLGHNVKIITTDVNRSMENEVLQYSWGTIYPINVSGEYASMRSSIEFLLKIVPLLKRENKNDRIDIIHIHSAYSLFAILSYWISIFLRKPIVYTLYSPIHKKPLNDRKGLYQLFSSEFFSKIFLSNPGSISCLSNKIKHSLREIGIEKNITIIPPIIDTSVFIPLGDGSEKRKELGVSNEAIVVLYCGSWTKWKGVHLLIQSIGELIKEAYYIRLIVAWGEPYSWYDDRKRELDELVRLSGLENIIIEVGIVNDMHSLMSASDIFVAPFINIDGVADPPLSVLEAMACGKIVIATRVGSLSEIIMDGHNGILVNPNDLNSLTDGLRKAISSLEQKNEMGLNASKYVINNYSPSSVSHILLGLYRELQH